MYKIIDLQGDNGFFIDELFKNKKDICKTLLDFHFCDFTGTDDKDNELDIDKYLKFWKIKGLKAQLKWILEYGQWEIEKCNKKGE
jgi:transcription termination factor NusB